MAAQIGLSVIPAVIAINGNISAEVDLGAQFLVGVYVPSGWTAATMTFQASPDGTNFGELFTYAGSELSLAAAASLFIAVDPTQWKGIRALKVRSGTSASPVTQLAAVTVQLVVSY